MDYLDFLCSLVHLFIYNVDPFFKIYFPPVRGANNFVHVSRFTACRRIIAAWDQRFKFIAINRSWPVRNDTRSRTEPPLATRFCLHGIIWNNPSRRWGEEQNALRRWWLSCVLDSCRTPVYCRQWGEGTVLGFPLHRVWVRCRRAGAGFPGWHVTGAWTLTSRLNVLSWWTKSPTDLVVGGT